MNGIQQIIYERTGVIVEPVTRPPTPPAPGQRAALDWHRAKRKRAAGIENVREWRRALGV